MFSKNIYFKKALLTGLLVFVLNYVIVSVTISFYFLLHQILPLISTQKATNTNFIIILQDKFPIFVSIFLSTIFAFKNSKKIPELSYWHGFILCLPPMILGVGILFIYKTVHLNDALDHALFFCIQTTMATLAIIAGNKYSKKTNTLSDKFDLTSREKEIVNLIFQGKSNKEIAQLLFITEGTVKNHLNNIFRKLNVKSKLQLMAMPQNEPKI